MAQDEARWRQEIDAWLSGPASEPPPGVASNFIDAWVSIFQYSSLRELAGIDHFTARSRSFQHRHSRIGSIWFWKAYMGCERERLCRI
ncbi:MAG: hypothetical protein Q9197_000534 [Variospora fuerteventurae]